MKSEQEIKVCEGEESEKFAKNILETYLDFYNSAK